jgi:hypothetical protein
MGINGDVVRPDVVETPTRVLDRPEHAVGVAWVEDHLGERRRERGGIAAVSYTVAIDVALIRVVRADTVVGRVVDTVVIGVHRRASRVGYSGGSSRKRERRHSHHKSQERSTQQTPLAPRHSL